MCRRRKVFIQIFIFLLIKVSLSQANCKWDSSSVENCSLKCTNSLKNVMSALNLIWTERPICHEEGLDLKLESVTHTDNTVAANFFKADVKVRALTMSLSLQITLKTKSVKSDKIEADAFNTGLKFMRKLVINNAMFDALKRGTFNGLENLESLKIVGLNLSVIDPGVLDVLNGTLTEFSLERAEMGLFDWLGLNLNNPIWIDGLTGAGAMDKLENVKFKYNLTTWISPSTFTGLTNVKTLDLSDCEIETIALGSFDSLQFLEILKLKDNRLTTITTEFFSNILIRNKTQIYLEGNRFICDCALMPFKRSLIEHSNFIGQPNCDSPEKFGGYKIIETKFDDETCVSSTTTTSSPPSSSTPSSQPTSTTSMPPLQCQLPDTSETIFIDPPAHTMQLYQTEDDDVVLRVDDLAENSILIWFSIDDPMTHLTTGDVNTNCQIGSDPTFYVDNLVTNLVYTFCIVDKIDMKNSPLDCVPFVKRNYPNRAIVEPWLYHNAKSTFIGITFVVCCVSILLGSAIGGLSYKMWMMKRKEPFIRSYQSSLCSSMSRSRASFMTRRTTNTTVQYFINDNFDIAAPPPPLPARPTSMYLMDEPVYATIRDIRSILAATQASDNVPASIELQLKSI